jgi:hypothetical protein
MPRIARNLQLLQNMLPREFKASPLVLGDDLLWTQRQVPIALVRGKLLLLLLDRLALPSAGHIPILIGTSSAANYAAPLLRRR